MGRPPAGPGTESGRQGVPGPPAQQRLTKLGGIAATWADLSGVGVGWTDLL